ncbi:MAG: hypothetical protein CMH64_00330 [Nanoarchaeota archaeon]|nr:hypothetical protein [Nanoarchaeota archaeon]|tara:strand:- start:384 stop:1355 length:972 start_codon:yes stop_codon:yes gene_type:complete
MRVKTKRKIQGFSLMLITILIFLFVGEILARASYDSIFNYDTEMWRYASFAKQPSENLLISHEHKPDVDIDLYGANVRINSNGLRDYDYEYENVENVKRILVLGDSVTFGWGVEFDKIYSKLLEKKLEDTQVINTGVGNYNTQMEVAFLKEEGIKYDPDIIILGHYINDAEMTPEVSNYFLKRKSYLYGYLWGKYRNSVGKLSEKGNFLDYYNNLYKEDFEGRVLFEDAINELKDISKEKGIPVVIVIIPELHKLDPYPFESVNEFIRTFEDENTYVLNVLPYLQGYEPESLWVSGEDAHPNEIANDMIAEAIYEKLIKENLV